MNKLQIVCINSLLNEHAATYYNTHGVSTPSDGEVYNIRDLIVNPDVGAGFLLEEIKNPKIPAYCDLLGEVDIEPNWDVNKFTYMNGEKVSIVEISNILKQRRNGRINKIKC